MFSWQIWDANLTDNSKTGNEFEQNKLSEVCIWTKFIQFIPYLWVVSQICESDLPWKHQQTTRWRLFSRLWWRYYHHATHDSLSACIFFLRQLSAFFSWKEAVLPSGKLDLRYFPFWKRRLYLYNYLNWHVRTSARPWVNSRPCDPG